MRVSHFGMLAAAAAGVGFAASVNAAVINFGPAQPISSPGDVTIGTNTLDRAYYFGDAANGQPYAPVNPGVLTINGVTFTNFDTNAVVDTKNGFGNIQNNTYGTAGQPADYGLLMTSADWQDNGGAESLTFNSLQIGKTYTIGIWISDARQPACCGGGRVDVTSGDPVGTNASILFNQPAGPAGEFAYGTFVADATGSQTVTFSSPTQNYQVNGVILSDAVPEPASLGLLGVGGLGLLARRRRA